VDGDPTGEPAGEDGEGQDWREAEAAPEAGMSATRTLRPGLWLAVFLLLAACQGPREAGRTGPGGGLGRAGAASEWPVRRIDLPAEPWAVLAERGGLWVVLSDRTVARYDPVTTRVDGAPVRLPFTPGAVVSGHGDLWIGGQVDGRRRVTAEGSYPVIQVARVDPRRRAVAAVITLPMRSNGNRLASTSNAVWVSDPAEGRLSRIWRVDPATNRLLRPPLRGGEEPLALEALGGDVWSANHDDGTLRRMDAATGALEGTVDLGVEPHGMAVAQGAIWVADAHHNAVLRVDPGSGRTVARIPVGFEPGPLVATPGAVWVATPPDPDLPAGSLARIDPEQDRLTVTVPLDGLATALVAGGERAWVATSGPDAILQLPS
jgi:streptogramin lyase